MAGYSDEHYEEYDPDFENDLEESKRWVWLAAQILAEWGQNVRILPTLVRPSVKEMSQYADNGDLEVIQRMEVKHRKNLQFTCREDFPFPAIFVDVAHAWDKAKPKPMGYMIFNSEGSYFCIVKGDTSKNWNRVTKLDKAKNRKREFYECPISLCTFHRVKPKEDTNAAST